METLETIMLGVGGLAIAGSLYGLYQSAKINYINIPDLKFRYMRDSTLNIIKHMKKKPSDTNKKDLNQSDTSPKNL